MMFAEKTFHLPGNFNVHCLDEILGRFIFHPLLERRENLVDILVSRSDNAAGTEEGEPFLFLLT